MDAPDHYQTTYDSKTKIVVFHSLNQAQFIGLYFLFNKQQEFIFDLLQLIYILCYIQMFDDENPIN